MAAAHQCVAERDSAALGMANVGIKKGTQVLLTNFFSPEKTCRPADQDPNVLVRARGLRGPVHPACHTADELERWQKNRATQEQFRKYNKFMMQMDAEARATEDAARHTQAGAQMAVASLAREVPERVASLAEEAEEAGAQRQLGGETPEVAIVGIPALAEEEGDRSALTAAVPKPTKPGPGRPRLTTEEREHRIAVKKIKGGRKMEANVRLRDITPSAAMRKRVVAMADSMAFLLHWPLLPSLAHGRLRSHLIN